MSTITETIKSVEGHDLLRHARLIETRALKPWPQSAIPSLSDDEYGRLLEDIAEHGVQVPIEIDGQGNVLDGHHRLRAAIESGIEKVPVIIRHDLTDAQKRAYAFRLNLHRRQLNRTQRDELIRLLLAEGASTRQAAEEVGTSKSTVAAVAATVQNSTVDGAKVPSETVIGKDERTRQRTSPKRKAAGEARRKPKEKVHTPEELREVLARSAEQTAKRIDAMPPMEPKRGATAPSAPDEETSPEATSAEPAPEQPKTARGKSLAVEEIIQATQHTTSVLVRYEQAPPRRREDVLASVDVMIREARAFLKKSGAKLTGGG